MPRSLSVIFQKGLLAACLLTAAPFVHAATLWTGSNITFTHATPTELQDQLTASVRITRGGTGGLYNSVTEGGAVSGVSPANTTWAVGSLANFNTLTYGPCPLESGHRPPNLVGTTYVVHLVSDDIYLSLTLTAWGGAFETGDRSFTYVRSTPAAAAPTPTVTITNLPGGSVFAAPANVTIGANATVSSGTVSSGTVTNVQFFTNGVSFKSVQVAPFIVNAVNLAAGAYALTAAATAAGISATSTVVNIIVDAPPVVTITNPLNNATFSAPANLTIRASATDEGSVTNVQFLIGTTVVTNTPAAPFFGVTNNLAAGSYSLSAIASDNNGVKNTNTISINVVTPVAVSLGGTLKSSGTNFLFTYPANIGLTYVVERSTNLLLPNWIRLATNTAGSNPVIFMDTGASNTPGFYRVGRLPNP
jgi:hypothetical protein